MARGGFKVGEEGLGVREGGRTGKGHVEGDREGKTRRRGETKDRKRERGVPLFSVEFPWAPLVIIIIIITIHNIIYQQTL